MKDSSDSIESTKDSIILDCHAKPNGKSAMTIKGTILRKIPQNRTQTTPQLADFLAMTTCGIFTQKRLQSHYSFNRPCGKTHDLSGDSPAICFSLVCLLRLVKVRFP